MSNNNSLKSSVLKNLKCLTMLFLTTGIVFSVYINISRFWVNCGGITDGKILSFEMPFLLFLSFLLYFPTKSDINNVKKCLKNIFAVQIPLLGIYISHDIFYSYLGESPRISDFKNFFALFKFSPIFGILSTLYLMFLISTILFLIVRYKHSVTTKKFSNVILFKLTLLAGLAIFLNSNVFFKLHKRVYAYFWFSQSYNIKCNGRISSFLY